MPSSAKRRFITNRRSAFTLAELLVSIGVLALLVILVATMVNSTTTITNQGNKRMDTDNQSRPVLDRMAEDFSRIVKRSDLNYYLKANATDGGPAQTGNDQIAFYSTVLGYYPPTGSQSPISLVAYRVNARNQFERMGKGLLWNGVSPSDTPMVFLPLTIALTWPAATSNSSDNDYEVIGTQVFRFEYFYQLNKLSSSNETNLSGTPWDKEQGHSSVDGLRDVGAVVVTIATIDPKSRVLVLDAQLATLVGQMVDYSVFKSNGQSGKVGPALTALWQGAVNSSTLPQAAKSGIRTYARYLYLNGQQQ